MIDCDIRIIVDRAGYALRVADGEPLLEFSSEDNLQYIACHFPDWDTFLHFLDAIRNDMASLTRGAFDV